MVGSKDRSKGKRDKEMERRLDPGWVTTQLSTAWCDVQEGESSSRGTHPPISQYNERGVVDRGKGSSRVVFIKELGVGSGRRKFPGVDRKPLSDLWSLQLPRDS